MTDNNIAQICGQLKKADKIAVFCHARPDGDAIGAGSALTCALRNLGKTVELYCEDKPSEKFNFLPVADSVCTEFKKDAVFDTFVCVDCADIYRLGKFADVFLSFKGVTVNIDHHISNKRFAALNLVSVCSATCEIMSEIFEVAGFEINKDIADLLMLGLVSDSGNFTHSDVTDKTFKIASVLRLKGADVNKINYNIYTRQTKMRALLFGKVIKDIRFELDDKLSFVIVHNEDIKDIDDKSITEGFVDFGLTVDGVEVSVSMLEVKRHQFKISLRSKGKVNVNSVAETFGGGGHVLASGCMLFGDVEEIIDKITYAVYQNL